MKDEDVEWLQRGYVDTTMKVDWYTIDDFEKELLKTMACYNEEQTAKLGYTAYAKSTGGKNYLGEDMPAWSKLPDMQKTAWIAATAAMFKCVNDFFIAMHSE